MSKAVRIREHLYAEVERLAKQERRSILGQLEILLEQALRIEGSGAAVGQAAESGSAPSQREEKGVHNRDTLSRPERAAPEDDHFRPDFKKERK